MLPKDPLEVILKSKWFSGICYQEIQVKSSKPDFALGGITCTCNFSVHFLELCFLSRSLFVSKHMLPNIMI